MLPLSLPWAKRRFAISAALERPLRRISPRTIDRRLQARKRQARRRLYGRTKPGTLLKHHIPIRTEHWNVTTPGFTEVDLVSNSQQLGRWRISPVPQSHRSPYRLPVKSLKNLTQEGIVTPFKFLPGPPGHSAGRSPEQPIVIPVTGPWGEAGAQRTVRGEGRPGAVAAVGETIDPL
jgi:hypothetical protein